MSRELADRQAIRDLISRYAAAIDDRDFGAVAACFADDAKAEYSGHVLEPGVTAIVRHLELIRSIPASTHLIGNVLIELRGDQADVRSQAVVHLVLGTAPGQGLVLIRGLHYHDRVVRQAERWVIAERRHGADWSLEVAGTSTL